MQYLGKGNQNYVQRILILLTALFLVCAGMLIIHVISNPLRINDAWVLDGVWPYFVLLTLLYSAIVVLSHDLRLIAMLSVFYVFAFNIIPILKYDFVYGYNDPLLHYRSIKETVTAGHSVELGYYQSQYASTPGMHILVSALAIITGLDVTQSIKLFLALCPIVLPLGLYFVAKRFVLPNDLTKAILISSVIAAPVGYIYTGTVAVYPLYVLFVYSCLTLFTRGFVSHAELPMAIVLWLGILVSHDATLFFILVYVFSYCLYVWLRGLTGNGPSGRIPLLFVLFLAVTAMAHFILSSSTGNFLTFLSLARDVFSKLLSGAKPLALGGYYAGFYDLSITSKICISIVRFAKDGLLIMLVVLAPIALWKSPHRRISKRFYHVVAFPLIFALLVFFLFLLVRPIETRGLIYAAALAPFLVGLTIFHFFSSIGNHRRLALGIVVFSLIGISSLTTFPFQPLIPNLSTSAGTFPVFDTRQVNSIYDLSMISFASLHYCNQSFWADSIGESQIFALTSADFQSSRVSDKTQAQLLLLSDPGLSHTIPSGRDAEANERYLQNTFLSTDTVYSNGKSFIFHERT